MEAAEIISTARSSNVPSNWVVLPLRRNQVAFSILGWAVGVVLGLGLFAGLFAAAWPDNFHSVAGAIITSFFLALLGLTGFGSLWLLIKDARRWLQADTSMIVITPDVYFKQEAGKSNLVPLEEVGFITMRGVKPPNQQASWAAYNAGPDTSSSEEDARIASSGPMGNLFGGRRRKPRGPTSVAFVDLRTEKRVVVTEDHSYAHPFEIGETLRSYVEARLKRED
jgi:hypothetical protein